MEQAGSAESTEGKSVKITALCDECGKIIILFVFSY